jgi:hypothetical protein
MVKPLYEMIAALDEAIRQAEKRTGGDSDDPLYLSAHIQVENLRNARAVLAWLHSGGVAHPPFFRTIKRRLLDWFHFGTPMKEE